MELRLVFYVAITLLTAIVFAISLYVTKEPKKKDCKFVAVVDKYTGEVIKKVNVSGYPKNEVMSVYSSLYNRLKANETVRIITDCE